MGDCRIFPYFSVKCFHLAVTVARVCLIGGIALFGALPAAGRPADGPDLRHISWDDEGAVAPGEGGGAVRLTLDRAAQAAAQRLLQRARPAEGAVVLADARTGELLAWADVKRGRAGSGEVLLRRRYPSASIFKLATTAALLERARVPLDTEICTAGGERRLERRHLERPHGRDAVCSRFADALGHSRNAVYAQLVTRHLTRADLVDTARALGFGADVPFDVRVPFGSVDVPVGDLELARTATGFVGVTLSPLGGASIAGTIAAGGRRPRFTIVRAPAGAATPDAAPVLSATNARQLRRMMEVTVHSGTSRRAFTDPDTGRTYLPGIRVAGKTGTLQPSASEPTTSWFVGFAPSRSPEVVVSVVLQNGAVYRAKANELARDVLRAWFHARGRAGVTDPLASAGE